MSTSGIIKHQPSKKASVHGRKRGASVLTVVVFLVLPAARLLPLPFDRLDPVPSTVITDRNGEILRITLAPDGMWRLPVAEHDLSSPLKAAVIAYEDRHFYRHPGVNPVSLFRAAIVNARAGRIVQGGSTITMQLARLMEPRPRTYGSKLIEILRALQLEVRYSKDEILAHYLNLAPYGGNLVGIGAASRFYFDKHSKRIGPGEAALLAAIPRSPNELRPDRHPEAARSARDHVIRLISERSAFDERLRDEALAEPVPASRRKAPFEAPHLTGLLERRSRSTEIASTIDIRMQRRAEEVLAQHLQPLEGYGVTNGAIVVIDNRTREVLALVGSGDFFDDESRGQVNGARAPRSPGSTLKPFVYALALDHGLIAPHSLVRDLPVDYAGYRPVNFDGTYQGAISAEEALIRSKNVPAVNLSAKLGGDALFDFLRKAGVTTLHEESDHYGLSLVLGGAGVNLLELTNLYAGLADGGRFRSYVLETSGSNRRGARLLSEETSFVIGEILSRVRRPDMPASWEWSVNTPKIAWKTGTSYGHRDAWSIGYAPEMTIGVWVGNFDGRGSPVIVGAEVAAPILFGLFEAFSGRLQNRWFSPPQRLSRRKVCAVSGAVPSRHCPVTVEEWYLPNISPAHTCDLHRMIVVDVEQHTSYCSHCRSGHEVEERVVEQWPVDLGSWMMAQGYPVPVIPPHNSDCPRIAAGAPPAIVSPVDGAKYKLASDSRREYQKVLLQASASNRTSKIFWFLNDELIHSGRPEQRHFITPQPGHHRLVCQDDEGRAGEVWFSVEDMGDL